MRRTSWLIGLCALLLVACEAAPTAVEPTAIPTSLPNMGTVKGTLLDISNHKPIADRLIILAKIHPGAQLSVAALDPNSSLKYSTDAAGRFVIVNVPPDSYALGMLIPTGYVLILDPKTAKEMTIGVKSGEVVDFGELAIDPVVRDR